ncbi:heterokaryon incompatibility protein-domain-containing protein [Ustulina deusta]|nr:heterokaryon incompatibility protein-domain-containing protein [Ustulina deusta]
MNIRQCTIYEVRDAGYAPRVNPGLCSDCQDLDNVLHVNYCRERTSSHAPLNSDRNYCELKALRFFLCEHFVAHRDCIMCSAVVDALQRASGESGDDQETRIAMWRPFTSASAMKKGMHRPRIIEFVLRYEKWCYDLSRITPWDRKVMDASRITNYFIAMFTSMGMLWNVASASPKRQNLQLRIENIENLENLNSLIHSILSEMIADATNLCVEIGQRYLWDGAVDAMGVIYDRPFLTIDALGENPAPSLVGLLCRPRQQSFQTETRIVTNPF